QGVHERIVAIPPVADELLLLLRPDVEELGVGPRLLQGGVVFFLGRRAAVVEDDDGGRVAIAPEMLVVLLHRLADVPEPVRRDDEVHLGVSHHSALWRKGAARGAGERACPAARAYGNRRGPPRASQVRLSEDALVPWK